jgi:hypothetical protein
MGGRYPVLSQASLTGSPSTTKKDLGNSARPWGASSVTNSRPATTDRPEVTNNTESSNVEESVKSDVSGNQKKVNSKKVGKGILLSNVR